MGGTVTDMTVEDDKCWAAFLSPENIEGVPDTINVVGVANSQDVPPVGQKPGRDILGEGDACVPLDSNVVVVVYPAKIVETQVAGQRRCFRRDPLHHAA